MTTPTAQMINLTLSVDAINMVLAGLGQLPYKDSYQVVNEITKQGQSQLSTVAAPVTDVVDAYYICKYQPEISEDFILSK